MKGTLLNLFGTKEDKTLMGLMRQNGTQNWFLNNLVWINELNRIECTNSSYISSDYDRIKDELVILTTSGLTHIAHVHNYPIMSWVKLDRNVYQFSSINFYPIKGR